MNDFLIKNRFTLFLSLKNFELWLFCQKMANQGQLVRNFLRSKRCVSPQPHRSDSLVTQFYNQMLNRRIINILTVHTDGLTQKSKKSGVVFRREIILSEFFINKQSININQQRGTIKKELLCLTMINLTLKKQ